MKICDEKSLFNLNNLSTIFFQQLMNNFVNLRFENIFFDKFCNEFHAMRNTLFNVTSLVRVGRTYYESNRLNFETRGLLRSMLFVFFFWSIKSIRCSQCLISKASEASNKYENTWTIYIKAQNPLWTSCSTQIIRSQLFLQIYFKQAIKFNYLLFTSRDTVFKNPFRHFNW